ncbi:hypothetical protein JHK86_004575 [Glycine max]|nr:hypothetical protein JHK86_004575 [Glycine max]
MHFHHTLVIAAPLSLSRKKTKNMLNEEKAERPHEIEVEVEVEHEAVTVVVAMALSMRLQGGNSYTYQGCMVGNLHTLIMISNVNGLTIDGSDVMVKAEQLLESSAFCVQPHDLVQMKDLDVKKIKTNVAGEDMNLYSQDNEHTLSQKNAISHPK